MMYMLDVLGLDIGRDLELRARAYAATVESACYWWPHRQFVIVSERPTVLERKKNGDLKRVRWEWESQDGKPAHWEVLGEG